MPDKQSAPIFPVAIRVVAGDRNEDRAVHSSVGDRAFLLLADGAGGLAGGAAAAEFALGAFSSRYSAGSDLVAVVAELDHAMAKDARFGETTFVVAAVHAGTVRGASVGDSGAWLVRRGGSVLDLTADQRRKPLLGSGAAVPISFGPYPAEGRLLLASDGLFKYAARERIAFAAQVANIEEAADALVALPRLPSGALQDDVAVVLADLTRAVRVGE